MAPKTLLLLSILAVIFMIAYAGEAARDVTMHSGDAENVGHVAHNKVDGIEDAKYGNYPGGGGYPGRGGGYPGGGGPGGRNSCRFGCCGRRDYNGICQRCCPHPV
ncbi:hypothetical protein SOVF_216010 [Spinacia oleracea]|uniref:Glycine-rich protein 3 short isoform-like n=1 Tax=Spinacia oleracea TaxID=3562 RepID=A0A9R0HWP8_SPIOL|nr:glycine-rich protein 3 short isoform-like [Spinacia oleracea]KNA02719.1 hypothetical protein SOVF_216010 [Spinacia oleracea]